MDVIERILRHLGLWPALRSSQSEEGEEGVRVHAGADPPRAIVLEPWLACPAKLGERSRDDPFPACRGVAQRRRDYDTEPACRELAEPACRELAEPACRELAEPVVMCASG